MLPLHLVSQDKEIQPEQLKRKEWEAEVIQMLVKSNTNLLIIRDAIYIIGKTISVQRTRG